MKAANDLVDVIRSLIKQELSHIDSTALCEIVAQVDDDHYDVCVVPDTDNIISNVTNMTKFSLKKGDFVYIYKINNQLNNAFIVYKIIPASNTEVIRNNH